MAVATDVRLKDAVDQDHYGSVIDPSLNTMHEDVMIDTVEEFLQIHVHGPAITITHVLLCLTDGLVRGTVWAKPKTGFGERVIPVLLQDLQQCLLDEAINHGGDT